MTEEHMPYENDPRHHDPHRQCRTCYDKFQVSVRWPCANVTLAGADIPELEALKPKDT